VKRLKFLIAKALRRVFISALRDCCIDPTAVVLSSSQLTKVNMGRYSYCGYGCRFTDVDIGAFCSISDLVSIGGAEHPTSFVSTSPVLLIGRNTLGRNFSEHNYARGDHTEIGHDVWIGYGAIIKSGIKIGQGAVIGMGSVVTQNVPPYAIWAGNPAREIRKRFNDEIIELMLASRWWERPDVELIHLAKLFHDPIKFLKSEDNS
jgi:acetyltransferase-like isoleucine patch superfamily enzyme